MDKDYKITFDDLASWLDKPLSNGDIDLINFILTSIENRYKHLELQQKVNQLEINIDELKKWLRVCLDEEEQKPLSSISSGYEMGIITTLRSVIAKVEELERGKEC